MKLAEQTTKRQDPTPGCCPVCHSELFYPFERSQAGCNNWRLHMVCPDCFAWQDIEVSLEQVQEIKRGFSCNLAALARQLAQMEKRNMTEECEKFISALKAGHILPIDF